MSNTDITGRFFKAVETLITLGKLDGIQPFCRDLGVDKRNFYAQMRDHTRNIIKACWLSFIVREYGISAHWLLTGQGRMMP